MMKIASNDAHCSLQRMSGNVLRPPSRRILVLVAGSLNWTHMDIYSIQLYVEYTPKCTTKRREWKRRENTTKWHQSSASKLLINNHWPGNIFIYIIFSHWESTYMYKPCTKFHSTLFQLTVMITLRSNRFSIGQTSSTPLFVLLVAIQHFRGFGGGKSKEDERVSWTMLERLNRRTLCLMEILTQLSCGSCGTRSTLCKRTEYIFDWSVQETVSIAFLYWI